MCQSLEFVRSLIMTYVHKHVHKQIRNVRNHSLDPEKCKYGYGRTSCEFCDDRVESGDIKGHAEGGHISSFVNGRDCFVILPTGYVKLYVMFCYRTFSITFVEKQGRFAFRL